MSKNVGFPQLEWQFFAGLARLLCNPGKPVERQGAYGMLMPVASGAYKKISSRVIPLRNRRVIFSVVAAFT